MNTTPLLSVMIPSRFRFNQLIDAIRSWYQHSASPDSFEILVWLNVSDQESMDRVKELKDYQPKVRVYSGRDKEPLEPSCWLWNQVLPYATGLWHQYWSDDMTLWMADDSPEWDQQLRKIATDGIIVQPQWHKLGGSMYENHEGGPVPFVPARIYDNTESSDLAVPCVPEPPDTGLDSLLRNQFGWRSHFLSGVGVFHDRHVDRTLTRL